MRERSVLTDGLPCTVPVDGVEIPVETDYRAGLLFYDLLRDTELPEGVRLNLFAEFACGGIPAGTEPEQLYTALFDFYAMENPVQLSGGQTTGEPVMDFTFDGDRILASFQAAYGIDLTAVRMHWWQFLTLLAALPPDTVFMRTVRLRMLDLSAVEDDGLRHSLRLAKRAVRIPRDTIPRDAIPRGSIPKKKGAGSGNDSK